MKLKFWNWATALVCVFAVCTPAVTAKPMAEADAKAIAAALQFTAKPVKEEVEVGQPVWVDLNIKNVSDKPVKFYYQREIDSEYSLMTVTDERGRPVPLTGYGRQACDRDPLKAGQSFRGGTLKPGQEYQGRILVSRMFDMSLFGTYTIVVSRWVPFAYVRKYGAEIAAQPVIVRIVAIKDSRTPQVIDAAAKAEGSPAP